MKRINMKRVMFSLLSVLMLISMALPAVSPPPVQAAEWPYCDWKCTAKDVTVEDVWLNVTGAEGCEPGVDNITGDI
jgi:hypothetical protein